MKRPSWHKYNGICWGLPSAVYNIYNSVPLCLTWCSLHLLPSSPSPQDDAQSVVTCHELSPCCDQQICDTDIILSLILSLDHLITCQSPASSVRRMPISKVSQADTGQDLVMAVANNLVQTETMMMLDPIHRITERDQALECSEGVGEVNAACRKRTVWIPCSFLCVLWLMSG